MSSPAVTNPPQNDLKTTKKKRGKADTRVPSATPSIQEPVSAAEAPANGAPQEFAFIKELQKTLRNATKKLNATAKVDTILAENPGVALDDLVAAKKINADQKAQILKKPALQESIASIEEQLAQFKQYGVCYEERLAKQKEELEKSHKEELESVKAGLQKSIAEAVETAEKAFNDRLLVVSKFLRAAAAMRLNGDGTSGESRAFEALLFQVYGGNEEAVSGMVKLIEGVDENVPSIDGEPLEVAYSTVKQASLDHEPPTTETTWTDETQQPATTIEQTSDPTLANAGMTELQDEPLMAEAAASNGFHPASSLPVDAPAQTVVTNGAANQMAQTAWNPPAAISTSQMSEEWVNIENVDKVPEALIPAQDGSRPPYQPSNSWAEDIPQQPAAPEATPQPDGFERVVHHTRQNSGRGRGFRPRGPRGDGHRGRGGHFRGDRGDFRGRGRGRGEFRGGRGRGSFPNHGGEAPAAQ